MDNLQETYYRTDLNGTVLFVSARYAATFKLPPWRAGCVFDIDDIDENLVNPYPYTTKHDEEVSFRLLTVNDEEAARKFCNNNRDYEESFVMLCMSINFKQVLPLSDKIKYIEES